MCAKAPTCTDVHSCLGGVHVHVLFTRRDAAVHEQGRAGQGRAGCDKIGPAAATTVNDDTQARASKFWWVVVRAWWCRWCLHTWKVARTTKSHYGTGRRAQQQGDGPRGLSRAHGHGRPLLPEHCWRAARGPLGGGSVVVAVGQSTRGASSEHDGDAAVRRCNVLVVEH